MVSDDDVAWLAGLSDAEACFTARMHGERACSVILQYEVGLVREDVMLKVRQLIQEILRHDLPDLHRDPPKPGRRAFFRCRVVRKEHVEILVRTLLPALSGKRLEARISSSILSRAAAVAKYRAGQIDSDLCGLSQKLKRGIPDAALAAERLLGLDAMPLWKPGPAWLAGMFDGDGCVSMAETRRDDRYYYQPFVNIASSDAVALTATRNLVTSMGFEALAITTAEAKGKARPGHGFNIAACDIDRFLTTIRSYLRVKGAEVDVLLDVYRGVKTREDVYPILRALKQADDPAELLANIDRGIALPDEPVRKGSSHDYRRVNYDEMKRRGWLSSEQARAQIAGGLRHAAWDELMDGFDPDERIGNKRYFDPTRLVAFLRGRVDLIGRADARERLRARLAQFDAPLAPAPKPL